MTPHEKAVNALNRRLERLQAGLRDPSLESARPFLFQSLVGTLGVADALTDYIREVGAYARRRHAELKEANAALIARHADMLKAANALLDQLKASPENPALRKEIDLAQQAMAGVQKNLKRGANSLQRDVAPSVALIDAFAESVRRLGDADQPDALKRLIKSLVAHVRDLYADHPSLPSRSIIDASAWEESAVAGIDEAAGFSDAYARTTYQAILALSLMTMAVSANPPQTAEDATNRGTQAVAARLQEITARFTRESEAGNNAGG